MTTERKVPKATLQRYPVYLKALRKLKADGETKIMSRQLADYVSIESTTIRRDFSFLGSLGKQGYGYNVDDLIKIFSDDLGKALLNYNKWNHVVGEIVCAFDLMPDKVTGASVPVYALKDIREKLPKGCRIAILCISQDVQNTVDLLVDSGIKGFVSFAVDHFSVPQGVYVKQVDVVSSIQELVFETNSMKD